jgi:2-methylcitrate dehydratase PrpD
METNPVLAYGSWLAEAPADWPEAAWEAAHRAFIDTIAVAIPGAAEPVTGKVFEAVQAWGAGTSTAILQGARLPAPWAALVNGTAAHALDFDDNFDPAKAHASAVLVPAILALAEQDGISGRACLDAYIAGLQILGRVGQGVNPVHRNRGWHATATVACARLLGLDAQRAAFAVSLATSMAGGFMAQFGTMAKPVHAGLAAKSGILAAGLARAGIDAGLDTLDGPTGMNRLMVGPDYESLRDTLIHVEHGQNLRFETARVGEPLLLLSSGLKAKRFPNCGSAHRAMDGLAALQQAHGFAAEDVRAIHVHAPVTHFNNLMYTDPKDAPQARFSLEYGLACLLVTGHCTLADFTDKAVLGAELQALYPRIHRHPVDKAEGEFATRVEVILEDGRAFRTEIPWPAGSLSAPFTDAQLWAKFGGCTAPLLPPERAAALRDALEALPDLPNIAPLMAPLYEALP